MDHHMAGPLLGNLLIIAIVRDHYTRMLRGHVLDAVAPR